MSHPLSPDILALEDLARHGDVTVRIRRRAPDKGHTTWIVTLDSIVLGPIQSEPRLGARVAIGEVEEALRRAGEIE